MKRVCVFCGSSTGSPPHYARTAAALGTLLAERGLGAVFGGGKIGLMGVLADAALAAGGEVIGVIPEGLRQRELGHDGVSELHVVGSMTERKQLMAELADGFIALPGGMGTLDELFEMLTWSQLGLHAKPCGLVNESGFYDPLLAFLERGERDGFIRPEHRALLLVESAPAPLLERMLAWREAAS
jgi:uncharacterized protein (TIGR00730 family)